MDSKYIATGSDRPQSQLRQSFARTQRRRIGMVRLVLEPGSSFPYLFHYIRCRIPHILYPLEQHALAHAAE